MMRIVTDGGCDMPKGWQEDYQIDILPLTVRFGEETYLQGRDIDGSNFYDLVKIKNMIPKTSLPSPFQIAEFYRKVVQKGDEILSIHIGSKMSGTFAAVQAAVAEINGQFPVTVFDSGAGSAALGFMCREARVMDRAGRSVQDIVERLIEFRKRLSVIFTVDNLDFAYLNGRVNALQSVISSMLKIKPIIILRDGLLQMGDKVRSRQKALDRIIASMKDRVGDRLIRVAVVHAADPITAQKLVEKVKILLNVKEIVISELSIPVAANLGPGTVGLVAIPESDGEESK